MTKTEQQRIALALLKLRPDVLPGTRAIIDCGKRTTWHATVSLVGEAVFNGTVPAWWLNAVGCADSRSESGCNAATQLNAI